MRKRILALVLCAGMLLLGGCASHHEASASDPVKPSIEASDPTEDNNTEANGSTSVDQSAAPDVTEEPVQITASGIVLMSFTTSGGSKQVQLTCIDPETGEQDEFLQFTVSPPYEIASQPIMWASMPLFEGAASGRFSSDFTKLAVTRSLTDSTEEHAGWFDATGNFFDVTIALGLEAQSDFSDPPVYRAIGFTPNDEFIYADCRYNPAVYYSVPVGDISPDKIRELATVDDMAVAFGAPANMDATFYDAWKNDQQFAISDRLDNGRYIATFGGKQDGSLPESAIVEINPDTSFIRTEYFPEAKRFTWSGKLSPDGTKIAFLSCSSEVTYNDKPTELFIGSVEGDEPIKVPCELPDTEYYNISNGIYTMAHNELLHEAHYYCAIVGWE